ncbi:sigma factor [Guggenheimella bovis]
MDERHIVNRVMRAKGDSIQADEIIRDYLPFIKSEVSKFIQGVSVDSTDELSIAMIAFHEAIESYDYNRGAFIRFAALKIQNRLIDYYRKEKKYQDVSSLQEPLSSSTEDLTLEDTLVDPNPAVEDVELTKSVRDEIVDLVKALSVFRITLTDVSEASPKQQRTEEKCKQIIDYAKKNPMIVEKLIRTRKLPISDITAQVDVERKILDRHRNYLIAMMVILSKGYQNILEHLGFLES